MIHVFVFDRIKITTNIYSKISVNRYVTTGFRQKGYQMRHEMIYI